MRHGRVMIASQEDGGRASDGCVIAVLACKNKAEGWELDSKLGRGAER